jgi:hypothetical protein
MIYFKNLQTNFIIEFENENSIGDYFLNEKLFKKLTNTEAKNYEFAKELTLLKEQKIAQLRELYIKNQVAIVNGAITFPLLLKGDEYSKLKDRRNEAKENFKANVLVKSLDNVLYHTMLPYIVLSELIFMINLDYSEYNKIKLDSTVELIKTKTTKEEIENIDLNQFKQPITIDIDKLIKDTNNLTDAVLTGSGYGYRQNEIDIFRNWVKTLQVDSNGKYIIFEKVINK